MTEHVFVSQSIPVEQIRYVVKLTDEQIKELRDNFIKDLGARDLTNWIIEVKPPVITMSRKLKGI